jgi:hypothetical protein
LEWVSFQNIFAAQELTKVQYAFVQKFAADQTNTVIGIVRDKASTEKKFKEDGIKNVVLFEADIGNLAALKVRVTLALEQTASLIIL